MPRALLAVLGGLAVSYERGNPAFDYDTSSTPQHGAPNLRKGYRGTSSMRKRHPPYDPPTTLAIGLRYVSRGVRFLMSEVPLYRAPSKEIESRPCVFLFIFPGGSAGEESGSLVHASQHLTFAPPFDDPASF